MTLNTIIKNKIEDEIGAKIKSFSSLSGGCISDAYKIIDEKENNYFLKLNPSPKDLFIKESNGLKELKKANVIRVPDVKACNEEFLLTEFISTGKPLKKLLRRFREKVC